MRRSTLYSHVQEAEMCINWKDDSALFETKTIIGAT